MPIRLHIRANPTKITGNEYNELVRKYPLPTYLFIIDFVYDVDKVETKTITREDFNRMLRNG